MSKNVQMAHYYHVILFFLIYIFFLDFAVSTYYCRFATISKKP